MKTKIILFTVLLGTFASQGEILDYVLSGSLKSNVANFNATLYYNQLSAELELTTVDAKWDKTFDGIVERHGCAAISDQGMCFIGADGQDEIILNLSPVPLTDRVTYTVRGHDTLGFSYGGILYQP